MNLKTDSVVLEVVVHISTLHLCSSLMNFLIFLLSTDYILSHSSACLGLPTSTSSGVLPSGGIVVEPYLPVLAADCPLSQHLGFNLMSSSIFFLLSPHSHLHLIFRCYVVVIPVLGDSSNSSSIG